MYFSDFSSWYIMYDLWISSSMLARMTACRSVSMYSKIRYMSRSFSALITFRILQRTGFNMSNARRVLPVHNNTTCKGSPGWRT